ncbi:MAG: hypothetical protein KGL95_04045, partial [Patescibacteria group bacterium]|nr:hypothetical protein [Patescibacteria group bacterium]
MPRKLRGEFPFGQYQLIEHAGFRAKGKNLSHPDSLTLAQKLNPVARRQAKTKLEQQRIEAEKAREKRKDIVKLATSAFAVGGFDLAIMAVDKLPQPETATQMNADQLMNFFHQNGRETQRTPLLAFATAEITKSSSAQGDGQSEGNIVTLRPVEIGGDRIIAAIQMTEGDFLKAFEMYAAENPYYGDRNYPVANLKHALTRQEGDFASSSERTFALGKIAELVKPDPYEQVEFDFNVTERRLRHRRSASVYDVNPADLTEHLDALPKPLIYDINNTQFHTENHDDKSVLMLNIDGWERTNDELSRMGSGERKNRGVIPQRFFVAALAAKIGGEGSEAGNWVYISYPNNVESSGVT